MSCITKSHDVVSILDRRHPTQMVLGMVLLCQVVQFVETRSQVVVMLVSILIVVHLLIRTLLLMQ